MPSFLRFLCIAAIPVLLGAGSDSPGDEKKAKEPDAAAIAKLIEQLGSPVFQERQHAAKALEEIGLPALDALRNAVKGNNLEFVQRANRLISIIENSLEKLLVDYRGYGLPFPPDDAKFVRFQSASRTGEMTPYFFGFLLQEETKDKPALLLVGTEEICLRAVEIVEPRPELLKKIEINWWERSTFHMKAGLAVALQCKARGWHDFAQELWTASAYADSNRMSLAYFVQAYCKNELVSPGSDRSKTAKRMKALLVATPELNTEENQSLLKSLEATLIPSTAKPGTVEGLIDDLTDMCVWFHVTLRYYMPDPHYTRLAHMGFAAVPALIEHLDDDRLTRSIDGDNNISVVRVKDVVNDLLHKLSGEEFARGQMGQVDAKAWWDKASKEGEEAYFLRMVLGRDEKAEWHDLNRWMLSIFTEKYPHHLAKLYKTILDERPKMQSWPLAEAVTTSSLPHETKLELLRHAASHKNLEHRRFALEELKKLDHQQFMELLLAALEAIPKTPAKDYRNCPEKWFTTLVMATNDPRAWKTLQKVAKRSDVSLRLEFMNQMDQREEDGQLQQRLDFLAAFLDDTEMFVYAGFPRLAVRDLAIMQIALILRMPDKPDKKWTPEQWDNLRKKVKEALKR